MLTMKRIFALFLLPVLAGCLSPATPPDVSCWPLDYVGSATGSSSPKYGAARVSQLTVRAPYSEESIVVQRANGSVAKDPYNVFAALPSLLLKGVVYDALERSGLFALVVNTSSSVPVAVNVETMVVRLALDCRREGERRATASVLVRLLDDRTNEVLASAKGAGSEDAADGNYGAAFSRAVSAAVASALEQFR